jgi:ATP-dependent DNA helicase RecQ
MHKELTDQLKELLHNRFHFTDFREGQLESLTTLMTHGRLLCIQPTGYGKSLLYQLPSLFMNGITLVISPLLALMRDQVEQLNHRFGIPAVSFNTDQNDVENATARRGIQSGKIRILFIAPEQLESIERFQFLLNLSIQFLVVDEAHCISTWGHDFRPSYRQIIKLTKALAETNPDIKMLALTATANKITEKDIKEQLTVDHKNIIVQRESMNRPNIRLTVIPTSGSAFKLATLTQILNQLKGSGLIYCATRENTELVAEYLKTQGIDAAAYHAGIEISQKRQIQQAFIQDKYSVIAATNALGMGIDKSNLRFIIHFDFPGSITAYYQEVGRCGRDGLAAEGILLYDSKDSKIQYYFIDSAQPSPHEFQYVLNTITHSDTELNLTGLKRATGMHPTKLNVIVAELIEQGFLQKIIRQRIQIYQRTQKSGEPSLLRYETQYKIRQSELQRMQRYAEHPKKCLMAMLRSTLGDAITEPCGQCSQCTPISFKINYEKDFILAISSWLEKRLIPIILSNKNKNTRVGVALLDGKLRSPEFIQFMRERASDASLSISNTLIQLIQTTILDLTKHYKFSCIIPIPSRTWTTKNALLTLLSNYLKIPCLHLLAWQSIPEARQGELLNNDQRKNNVEKRMKIVMKSKVPKGTILLLDDYIGSGATMNEATRALSHHTKNKIVPFAIAAVKWHLGKRGMI